LLCTYARTQAQQRRLLDLQNEADALRQEVTAKDAALAEARADAGRTRQHAQELQAELDSNAGGIKEVPWFAQQWLQLVQSPGA
jgi:hypothetical protein